MAKIRILSPLERKAFQSPPMFQGDEKIIYFEIPDILKKIIDSIRSPYRKVGFILQYGYFRHVGRFFSPSRFHKQDIIFVSKLLNIDLHTVSLEDYKEHRLLQDQQKILEILGFQSFDRHADAPLLLSQEVTQLVAKQIRPKLIIYYLSEFFFNKKIVTPSYQQLAETILQTTEHFETQLLSTLQSQITIQHMKELDQLLPKIDPKKNIKAESYYARAPLVALREFPLSTRTGKIKESINGFLTIKKLFDSSYSVLLALSLSPYSLKYY